MSAALAEIDRRLANTIRVGHIAQLDAANARVKVECGELTTDWLPWVTLRAGPDRTWHAPEVGEQVVVLAPSGELAQAVALPSVYQDAHPAVGNTADLHRTEYSDGSFVQYDRAAHHYTINISGGAGVTIICQNAVVQAAQNVTVEAGQNVTVEAGGDVDVSAAGSATVEAPTITLDSPQTECTGALIVQGLLTYNAGLSGVGGGAGSNIAGGFNVTGGGLTHNGVNVGSTHTHSGVQPGGGSTGTPS